MPKIKLCVALALTCSTAAVHSAPHICPLEVTSSSPLELGFRAAHHNVLTGPSNTTVEPISVSEDGSIEDGQGSISWSCISPTIAKIEIKSSQPHVGADFSTSDGEHSYGVWEYPWSGNVENADISYPLIGVGNNVGINWCSARAPFFFNSAGYGVYVDTPIMGAYDFTNPDVIRFVFDTDSLTYYVIAPEDPADLKGIISEYTGLSTRGVMQPDSAYGPTYYSDNWNEDFHGDVSNAQENYFDVVDHLYHNEIRGAAMFADRPYGTGNYSFGNFDFDPEFYPDPEGFIKNLTEHGFDFQVWVANRAMLYTQLYNDSADNGWLFPGVDPIHFRGPALNLSIPAAYEYFKEKLSYFTSVGVKGYKIDRGEEGEMPESEQNIQDLLLKQLCHENMAETWGPTGYHSFSRSAYDRVRSETSIWNGDAHANYTGLAYSVASGIRSGLLGFSHWTSDTGGYVREDDEPAEDLWARWMHFSTFSVEYELMLGSNHTPWYPPYSSELVSILKQTANLHHELIPYIKSYSYQSTVTGIPVMRALFLEHPHDKKTHGISDAYFFGEEFLVAPIVTDSGERDVYFPEGSDYVEYFKKTSVYKGGSTAHVSRKLDSIPVFVKAGSIVPRGDIVQANNKWTKDWKPQLNVELFPSFNVRESKFAYYNGDEESEIRMTTSQHKSCVKLHYGKLGVGGKIVVYTKNGPMECDLKPEGGKAEFCDVESLFG